MTEMTDKCAGWYPSPKGEEKERQGGGGGSDGVAPAGDGPDGGAPDGGDADDRPVTMAW